MTQEGSPLGAEGLQFQIQNMRAALPQEMREDVAKKSRMYMNPDAVDVYPGIMIGGNAAANALPTAAQIYFAQVGLWVQQDVFSALAEANKDSKSVEQSPVKHLLKIEVLEEFGHPTAGGGGAAAGFGQMNATGGLPIISPGNTTGGGGGGGAFTGGGGYGPGGPPMPAGEGAAAVPPKGPTNRTPGQTFDVVPFRLVINVDATQIPKILTELSRNRFITVTKCDIVAREATSEMLMGYYYGQVPVVQLSLECEMLLLKTWLTPLMPAALNAAPAAPPA
jgi:hypothetical protein